MERSMSFPRLAVIMLAAAAWTPGLRGDVTAQGVPARAPALAREMRAHYAEVATVHEAVIRGDLATAKSTAAALARREIPGLPETTNGYRDAMKALAGKVASAGDVASAAAATGSLLGGCGDCHRAAGVLPVPPPPARHSIGETVGHMLDHQRAVDLLMQGLVVPSSRLWNEGAQGLRTAPLSKGKLPKDPKLTPEVVAGEKRVHELANEAAGTSDPQARAALYGQMLGTCAGCHSLHSNIWGPSKR
jgi:hypothetical protein